MSEVKKRKVYTAPSVNVDHHLVEQLGSIQSSSNNLEPITQLIQRGDLGRVLPIWSYYSSVNNHKEFVDITNKINHVLRTVNGNKDSFLPVRQNIIDIAKDILVNYSKITYRALSSLKPSSTNPTIRLLDNLINYDTLIAQEFLNSFDLTLPVLSKLMTPSKIEIEEGEVNDQFSIRSNFMKLWIDLCSNVAYYHRLDLLTNHPKIVKNIWKYLQLDSINLLLNLIQFLNDKLLDENNFKKAQKCKILNDSFMYKAHILFNKIREPFFLDFMTKVTSDVKNGLVFTNDKLWTQNSDVGVIVEVNNKKFKIANKLLYTLLTSLKPTDSNKELQFIVRVLSCCQELIPPYMNYLVQHGGGYHDPSLTSWWISHSLLYTNVLQIPMPKFETNVEFIKFDARAITESIVFAPLLKGALVEGLSSKTGLTVQLTLQLVLFVLKRLEQVIDVVNLRQELISLVFSQLPDVTFVAQPLSTISSKLTHLTALTIINKYKALVPSSLNKSSLQKLVSTGVSDIVSKSELSNYDLSILDLYMNLQNQDFKWWNKNNGANSFYTSLIKLASKSTITSSFATKIYHLLNRLSEDKMFFNQNLLVTPIMALIYSLDSEMTPEFWNMFDEVVARCVRSPYKYLDLAHDKYQDESIFVVAMFEQFKFLLGKGNDEEDLKWLFKFLKYMIVLGENKNVLASLVDQLDVNDLVEKFNLNQMLTFESSLPIDQDSSIMEVVYNSSVTHLAKNPHIIEKKLISSNLDYLAVLSLINLILEKEILTTQLITILFSKLWSFLMNSSQLAIDYFTSEMTWRKLLGGPHNGETKLVIQLYGETIKLIPHFSSPSLSKFVFDTLFSGNLGFIDYIWLLNETQSRKLMDLSSGVLFELAVATCIDKHIKLTFAQFWKLLKSKEANRLSLLTQLLESNLLVVTESDLIKVTDEIVSQPNDYGLLPVLIGRSKNVASWLLKKNLKDGVLNCLIVSSMVQNEMNVPPASMKQVVEAIQLKLDSKTVEESMWNQILIILSTQAIIDQSLIEKVLEQINFKQTTNPSFISFIKKVPQNDMTKTWLHKSMLYITKSFAESELLSQNFTLFVNHIGDYLFDANVWNMVPASILNTQLEVILQSKFIYKDTLKYAVKSLLASSKNKIDFQKLFQIALTSSTCLDGLPSEKDASLRYYSALIIYILYNFDHLKLSNVINLKTVLEKYQGLNRCEDLLLKFVLQKMEAKVSMSWIASVSNWEFSDELHNNESDLVDMDKLITKKSEQLTVSLNKGVIQNSLNCMELSLPKFGNGVEFWHQIEKLERENLLLSTDHLAYDCEFLYMVILNNDELLKYTKHEDSSVTYSFKIRNLIDTGVLQFIIANLSTIKYLPIAKIILNKILTSIDDEINAHFKDKNIFKAYLSTVCFTLQQQQEIPKLVWFVYSQFVSILANPGHFLYELSFRYVLAHPSLNKWDIPLYNSITHPTESTEWFYRELNWIIEQITNGLSSTLDLSLLTKNVIESVLNLINSKTLNMKLRVSILKFIYRIQEVDQGSDLLITRFGVLSYLEMMSKELGESNVFDEQLKVNIMQILSRFEVSVGESERVKDWTGGRFNDNLKRIYDSLI